MNEQELTTAITDIQKSLTDVKVQLGKREEWQENHDKGAQESRAGLTKKFDDFKSDFKSEINFLKEEFKELKDKYDGFFLDYTKKTGIALGAFAVISFILQLLRK